MRPALVALAAMFVCTPSFAASKKIAASPAPAADSTAAPTASEALKRTKDGYVKVPRGHRAPKAVDRVLVVNRRGEPVQSRRAIFIRKTTVKPGDSLRSISYRYSTSPLAVAHANGLEFDAEHNPLPVGAEMEVPVRYRAASGFARAVRLCTGPGVRAERRRTTWGRPYVIGLLNDAFSAMHRLWPNRHPAIVGSLSRLGGGRLRPHKSHRAGRDIDIGYFTRDAERKSWGVPHLANIDYERLWFFVDRLEKSGQLAAIYMSPRIQYRLHHYALTRAGANPERLKTMFQYPCARGARKTLIRHSRGHRDHMHIRFDSPADLNELSS